MYLGKVLMDGFRKGPSIFCALLAPYYPKIGAGLDGRGLLFPVNGNEYLCLSQQSGGYGFMKTK